MSALWHLLWTYLGNSSVTPYSIPLYMHQPYYLWLTAFEGAQHDTVLLARKSLSVPRKDNVHSGVSIPQLIDETYSNTLRFVSRVGHYGMKSLCRMDSERTNGDVVNGSNAWKMTFYMTFPCEFIIHPKGFQLRNFFERMMLMLL